MKKLHTLSRALLVIGSLTVILAYFVPLWEIKLWAPQYPEGLSIEIWHNDVKGDVEIINGLNHYIGMRHIKKEMFPEFMVLKYIIAAFIFWGLFVAYKGKLRWLKIYCSSIVVGGIAALGDFYRWGYDYGHNLDPTAPISIPGMAYQPPVLGYKVLLNFTALSIPSTGGWIVVGLGVLAFALMFYEIVADKKSKKIGKVMVMLTLPLLLFSATSCHKAQPKINFGKDDCDYCKMKIMDNRFGFAMVTDKGREYKFDDMNCLRGFKLENNMYPEKEFAVLFDQPGTLVRADNAFYLHSGDIKSPMGSNVAAFSSQEVCKKSESEFHAFCVTFAQLQKKNQ